MLVLSALCVLLPLAKALQTCDDSTANAFLAKPQLEGNLLDNFENKKFWFVASETEGSDTYISSSEIQFGSVTDNSLPITIVYRASNGTIVRTINRSYSAEGDRVMTSGNTVAIYFVKCSENLLAGYRCAVENSTAIGSKFFIWAAWDKSDAEVSGELETCKNEILKVDAAATFVYTVHP